MLVQRPEKLLCSGKLPGEEFPVALQFPSDTCMVMIQECLIGYACRTG